MQSTCIIIVAVWAAVIESHRLGGLSNKRLFLTVWKLGSKCKIKAPGDLVSGESLLPGLSSPQRQEETEREEASFLASLIRAPSPS